MAAIIAVLMVFCILNHIFPLQKKISFSTTISARDGTVLQAFLSADEKWRMKVNKNDVSSMVKRLILFKEDKWFYYHPGINPVAILRAFIQNKLQKKRTSGASTITMQVARLYTPRPRNYRSKIIEIFNALQLEWQYSKDEILLMYLSLVPYGGNIEGIKSAALLYLNKMPAHLSLAEATALSIIPNRPTSLRLGKNDSLLVIARNRWLKKIKSNNLFSPQLIDDALQEPIQALRNESPHYAPQLGWRLKKKYPDKADIATTIVLESQIKTQQVLKNYVRRLQPYEIYNAAALVINNETGEVEAYCGSADFFDKRDGGQVDGITALRSPGSTLKPFIYAKAFDKGIITPKTIISDVPVNIGGYSPENFDEKFNGPVTAEFALVNSLNIPAVKLLDRLGFKEFIEAMKVAGFTHIEAQERGLGLSLALGGCGVTLEELCRLYAALANDGLFRDLKYISGEACLSETAIMSPASAFLVKNILSGLTRPDIPNNFANATNLHKIAWKTGTSYGRRDAWSIGITPGYTVGVWVGNFSGKSSAWLTGTEIASPLLFEIMNNLHRGLPKRWFDEPEKIELRYVCTSTGYVPDFFCENKVMDYYIPGCSDMKFCDHLQQVYIDNKGNFSYCNGCMPDIGMVQKYFVNLPPELLSWYNEKKIYYEKMPPHYPSCERLFGRDAPQIISPANNTEYLIERTDEQELMLSAHGAIDAVKFFWFINDMLAGETAADKKLFYKPLAGKQKITCMDDKGRKSSINIKVKFIGHE